VERSRASSDSTPGNRSAGVLRRRALAVSGAVLAATVAVPATTAAAEPAPDMKEIRAKAERLNSQLETMTEQYNGLRVRLTQSKRAAEVAAKNAKRQEKVLKVERAKIGELAAQSYMAGGTVDPAVSMATSPNPQALLDQSAALKYFARQGGTRVQGLAQAMQAAERARRAAESRAGESERLGKELKAKKSKIQGLFTKANDKLMRAAIQHAAATGEVPELGNIGSGKAAGALKAAMSKLGKPYVWGAAGPNSFDCSGLTLWAYRQVGVNLPHFTGSQWNAGTRVSRAELRPGDLIFFYDDLHHMGMYLGDGKMIHAPQTGDVVRIVPISGRPFAGGVRVA
jgi:peptidoglycan DL-endopeptidase CwlO